jgi:hypothetical protein
MTNSDNPPGAGEPHGNRDPEAPTSPPPEPGFGLRTGIVLKTLAGCILALIALHMMTMVSRFGFGEDYLMGIIWRLDLGDEGNLPTYFSALQLLFAAVLLSICAAECKSNRRPYANHWVGLAVIFVILSIDEAALIHEGVQTLVRMVFATDGVFASAWIIPYGAFVIIIGLTYFRFLLSLPGRIGLIFALSGAVFVFGAIGLETFGDVIAEAHGKQSFDYMVSVTIEEILELAGCYGFVYGLLKYLTLDGRRLGICFVK